MKLITSNIPKRNVWNSIKSAWFEAFPQEVKVSEILEQRKKKVKLQRKIFSTEWTPEQLSEFEANIPEWKKGAIVFLRHLQTETINSPKRKSAIKNYIREKYKENADMIELLDELEGVKTSVNIMKGNLQQKILYSNNLIVNTSLNVITKVKEKLNSDAIAEMKKRDPEFDFDLFEKEIRFIFEEMYHEYLKHNIKFLEKICVGEALGHFRQMILEHETKFGVPKYTDILNVSFPILEGSFLNENTTPVFCFSLNFQEISCLVDPKNPDVILDGDESRMSMCDYVLYVTPHPDPDVETVGHGWVFFKIVQRNKVKQLI